MNIGHYSLQELLKKTSCTQGVCFDVGSFTVRLRSSHKDFISTFRQLYFDFPVISDDQLIDFFIDMQAPKSLRRWIRPQIIARIDGQEPFQPFAPSHAMPLFEWALNWCIARQGQHQLMLHAAVLEKHGKALILPALPGSGKSTLAGALAQRGWRFLSDEFCLIHLQHGQVIPIPRPTPLKNESIDVIRNFADSVFIGPLFEKTRKGTIGHLRAPTASIERMKETATPAWVIFPQYQSQSPVILEPLNKSAAFLKLATNSFNYSLLGDSGFKAIKSIIESCACYNLNYSNLNDVIAQLDALSNHAEPAL
ncbi:HprK-related kinase A [Crenothrix sp.]|uniref:HprK-related kinase A n=1 Tax=Crenothrix sp. TaxID=3100433 RepID=UPI00374C8F40